MHKISVTAHAGALNTKPNTLDSVRAALSCGADILEVDVRFLPGGAPVLGHTRAGPESARLEDVFALMRDSSIHINLDMKETSNALRVAELVAQYGLQGRAFMTGLSRSACAALRGCGLPYYLNGTSPAAAKALGALGVNINFRQCSKKLVRDTHALGLLISVWTADKPATMRKMLGREVDNITTRRPDVLQALMKP